MCCTGERWWKRPDSIRQSGRSLQLTVAQSPSSAHSPTHPLTLSPTSQPLLAGRVWEWWVRPRSGKRPSGSHHLRARSFPGPRCSPPARVSVFMGVWGKYESWWNDVALWIATVWKEFWEWGRAPMYGRRTVACRKRDEWAWSVTVCACVCYYSVCFFTWQRPDPLSRCATPTNPGMDQGTKHHLLVHAWILLLCVRVNVCVNVCVCFSIERFFFYVFNSAK